jgi:hypothetical protein
MMNRREFTVGVVTTLAAPYVLPLDDPPVFTNQIKHLSFTVVANFYSSCSTCSLPGFAARSPF